MNTTGMSKGVATHDSLVGLHRHIHKTRHHAACGAYHRGVDIGVKAAMYQLIYQMKKEGKSYTFETLEYLKSVFPSDELFLYMGSDMLLGFETVWRRTDEIMKLCTIVALSRTGDDLEKLENCAEHLRRDFGAKVEVFRIEPVVVSSSQIRALISEGKDVSDLVPKAVGEYIKEKGLYRGGENGDRCFGV